MRRFVWLVLLLAACATHRAPVPEASREQLQPPKRVMVQNGVDAIVDDQREAEVPPRDLNASDVRRRFAALRELGNMRKPQPPPAPPPGPPQPPGPLPNACEWSFAGPTNIHGRVLDIAIDPTDRNRLFIATVGGVWRSTDFARQWERVTDDIYAGTFGTVAINPATPAEVFIGGGDPNLIAIPTPSGGIWRSTTGGGPGSFTKTTPGAIDNSIVYRLRVDPKPPHDVYAATNSGLWRGVHSGPTITWSLLGGFNAWTSDVVLDDSVSPTLVYAGVQQSNASFARGIWKWDGAQWLPKTTGIDTAQSRQIRIAIAKSSPSTLYARVENTMAALQGIYKTTSGGTTWQKLGNAEAVVGNGCAASYMASMEVDPTDANRVYAGCFAFFRTTTGDANWSDVSGGADPNWQYWLHVDHHAIAFDPVNPKIVYVGHDGGLDRSSDTSSPVWHWTDVSHGLNIWQLYRITGQHDMPTLAAGGAQDTGTGFTFGNRSWYHQWNCDGRAVEHDAANAETFYIGCQGLHVQIRTNAVPGTPGYQTTVLPVPKVFAPPVVVDRDLPGRVLAQSQWQCGGSIMKSVDGVNFSSIGGALDRSLWAVHAVPGTNFQHYYAAMLQCNTLTSQIWRTTTGGPPWDMTSNGLPSGKVESITADPANGAHAYAVFESQVVRTIDGGANWTSIEGVAPDAIPAAAKRRAVAVDPTDPNILYVGTDVGPFRGTLGGNTTVWEPFDEGLPAGVDVRDILVDAKKNALVIGTWGYGVYRRELDPAAVCPARMLLVRDNVFDRGGSPSTPPAGVPDPEHPMPDPNKPNFFLADASGAGRLFWWSSTDVRIDVPSADPPQNIIADADHVELETCPILIMNCPAGTMVDSHPRRGKPARAYVQVTNGGKEPIANARVIALWTDTTTSTPLLPNDFWSATFPPPGTPCGSIAANSPWKLVDPAQPCRTIPQIDPPMPELARFDWNVPANAPEKACFLTIVESADDPLPASIRANNKLDLWNIVPQNRHMSVRNLHFVDPPMMGEEGPSKLVEVIAVPNPTPDDGIQIVVSQDLSRGRLRILLPREIEVSARDGIRKIAARLTEEERRLAESQKLDPNFVYEVAAGDGTLTLPVKSGETWRMGLSAEADPPARLDVMAMQGNVVLGGSSYLFRARRF